MLLDGVDIRCLDLAWLRKQVIADSCQLTKQALKLLSSLCGVQPAGVRTCSHSHRQPLACVVLANTVSLPRLCWLGCCNPNPLPRVLQMGLVSQDCLLFQGTLEDNIRYGTEHATSQQVVEAAKAAHAHDFISAMPHVSH